MRSAPGALLAVLQAVVRHAGGGGRAQPLDALAGRTDLSIRNSRGDVTGTLRAAGMLRFSA
jgi:hypothetical protein